MDLTYRPRRLRRTNSLREMVRENTVSASDFIYPLFVHEGSDIQEIAAMPGTSRWPIDGLIDEVGAGISKSDFNAYAIAHVSSFTHEDGITSALADKSWPNFINADPKLINSFVIHFALKIVLFSLFLVVYPFK